MCAFKDPFGSEAVSDSWYNQKLVFLEVSDPDSALHLVGLHFYLQLGATVKHYLSISVGCAGEGTQVMMCPVLPVMYPNHILTPWNDWGPGILLRAHCYFGCVCSFHVLGKAAGQEQPDCPEMFASPTALHFLFQKTLPEWEHQEIAIDMLLMRCGRAGVTEFAVSSLELENIIPALAVTSVPCSVELLPGG